ncbi:T9SS type A sorting domain-containing protein [Flavobacterium collinsii]|uniref:Secretion system C-terminal sorting domain-containing protein n=1 Tax=Flavobacterium collinsii TaxID=1114861 RepID=A0ABM8KM32_9FLAO|nr:T9SS type A sorting domain-containing protein [Flavobacterium collinsii]CAA9200915.1 hypothetical protein FLACOL7796_03524 [Flavobacterium collinsii]
MKIKVLVLLFLTIAKVNAQIVTEEINFNNFTSTTDNDLSNKFAKPLPEYDYQQSSDGSNGYFLTTSLDGAATRPLRLCSKFKGVDTETMTLSIDYKTQFYLTAITDYYNSVGFFIAKESGETVLSAKLSNSDNRYGKNLDITGLSDPNPTYNPSFTQSDIVNNNWYRLTFEITKIGTSKFSITAKIFDLGLNGTSNPVLKVTNKKEGYNYYFNSNNTMNIHIVGARWGDVKYLDNFKISGFKNGSNCEKLSNEDFLSEKEIIAYPNPFYDRILTNKEVTKVNIYNLNGQLISSSSNINKEIAVEKLATGTYIFEIFSNDGVQRKKLVKK